MARGKREPTNTFASYGHVGARKTDGDIYEIRQRDQNMGNPLLDISAAGGRELRRNP
jgi:hypothetical protein